MPTAAEPGAEDVLRLRDFGTVLRRNLKLVLGITTAALAIAILSTWWQDSVFESETTLQFDTPQTGERLGTLASLVGFATPGREAGPVANAIPVLTSRLLAETVVDSLSLHVQLLEPAAPRDSLLRVIRAAREAPPGEYVLELQGATQYRIRTVSGAAATNSLVTAGEPFAIGDVSLALHPVSSGAAPQRIRIAVRPFRSVVADTRKEIRVSPAGAQVVSLRFRSGDPLFAAGVPNALAANFIDYTSQTSAVESRNTVAFLREQVQTYEAQLRQAEAELQRFREQAGVVSLPHELSGQAGRLADLQVQRDEILAERRALSDLLARASRSATDGPSPYRQLASFPVFFSNGAVQGILQALTQLENRRADLMVLRTPENEDVRALNARISELERQLYEMAQSYLRSRETQLTSLEGTLQRFSDQVREVPERELAVARLTREAKLLEEIYAMVHTRLKEAEISDAAEPSGLRVLDLALVPERPVFPRPLVNVGLGLVLGVLLAGGIVFLREVTDTRIRNEHDIRMSAGGLPLLGAIPLVPSRRPRLALGSGRRAGTPTASPARLVTRAAPGSAVSEAYRALRTSIALSAPPSDVANVLAFASALPGEGKSTIVANLCISFAQQGTRTLLIDCDLYEGKLHTLLEASPAPGLADVLAGEITTASAIQTIGTEGAPSALHFLSAGRRSPTVGELIGTRRMQDLLAELRAEYQVIVLDTPPLRLVAAGALLAAAADMTILVAREGATDREALHAITTQLQQLGVSLSGLVLNGTTDLGALRGYGDYSNGRAGAGVGEPAQLS